MNMSGPRALLVASAIFISACGGGRSPLVRETPPAETEGPDAVRTYVTHERHNPSAEDLLDHWNEPGPLREGLDLTALAEEDVARRRSVLEGLLEQAIEADDSTATVLRNADARDLEVLGERDGITYGRWTGGPAGTLNIEFDWRFAESLDAAARARIERAGKAWSRRLLDDFGPNEAPRGTVIERYPRRADGEIVTVIRTLDEDVQVDDVLIAVVYPDTDYWESSGGAHLFDVAPDDLEPWFGSILLAHRHADRPAVIAHEIGHVISIRSAMTRFPSVRRYIDTENHTFGGPESRRVNGGDPVPFQWVNERNEPVPARTPGATVDYDHLGTCSTSIMARCSGPREVSGPTELDFAILADIGYEVLDADTASEPELYGYGAWGRYSAWGAGVERLLDAPAGESDTLRAGVDAFGIPPAQSLSDALPSAQGTVTWAGTLLGVDLGRATLPPVFGNAQLSVDLADLTGEARFTDLTVLVDRASHEFRVPQMQYDISVTGNSFADDAGRIAGGVYGAAHEEMAGVLDDRSPQVNLMAGFGGTR